MESTSRTLVSECLQKLGIPHFSIINDRPLTLSHYNCLNPKLFKPIKSAEKNSICFAEQKKTESAESFDKKIEECNARILFIPKYTSYDESKDQCIVICVDPKFSFAKLLLDTMKNFSRPYIHHSAQIGSRAIIGKRCTIEAGVVIHDNVVIGDDCVIMANTVIGGDGFGHVVNSETNEQIHFPHIGWVIIGDNVRIGSNTSIDKGALGDTIIEDNVRIDNLVHIAHNVTIGKNSMVVANCMIGGSTTIGENTWVGPSTSVLNQLKIGDRTFIGMAACVTKDIPNDVLAYGFPAKCKGR